MKVKCSRVSIGILALSVVGLMTLPLAADAYAAPIKKVLAACDRTPGCGYSIDDKTGDIAGCSKKSGKCFYCPNDGKRQCFAVGRRLPQDQRKPVLTNPAVTLE